MRTITPAALLNEIENAQIGENNLDLHYTDLSGVDFRNLDLYQANFRYCDLTGADFTGSNLLGADFTGAIGLKEKN